MTRAPCPAFDNSYARLPQGFYTRQHPEPVPAPGLIRANHALGVYLGFDPHWLESGTGVEFMAGNYLPGDADPIATVYAGHQFGSWVPQLGDGRAILLGEVIAADGIRHDIQLKGSGRTPYSRAGDGRAPLGPVLREYIVSEAMAALDVPTTRALGAVTTGQYVLREERLPGAVLARVAQSHIRIGSFQYFAAKRDIEALQILADHVIQRHYPQAAGHDEPLPEMLAGVVRRQANLIAQWQHLGFIHGVMNTDNMLLSGETVDYGPCAFMDHFDNDTVFSSIDHAGRYAYRNQAHIAHWNLAQLVQALLPLLDDDRERAISKGQAIIDEFPGLVQAAYLGGMYKKLGLHTERPGDMTLVQDLLELMQQHGSDFTLTFRRLAELAEPYQGASINAFFQLDEVFDPWLHRWQARLAEGEQDAASRQATMLRANPVFIPRNHLVEEAITAAENSGDLAPFHALVDLLAQPFDYKQKFERYAKPPLPGQEVRQTFCGT